MFSKQGPAGSGHNPKEVPGQVLIREVPVLGQEGCGWVVGGCPDKNVFKNDLVANRQTGFQDGSRGEPVAVALVPALVINNRYNPVCMYLCVGRLDYGECFGQYPVSLEDSDSLSGRNSENLNFGESFLVVARHNYDVIITNISKD